MSQQLSLKIHCGGQSKVFRFGIGTVVAEACREVGERLGVGAPDWGLYQAKTKAATKAHARTRWLPQDKALGTLALDNGDELEYKSTQRPVKVAMPDGSTKTVMIDDSAVVEKIIDQLGLKLGLANAEEYGISVNIGGKETWLQPRFTLQEQPAMVKPDANLNFRKRFFVDDANVDKSDPTQLSFIYTQSVGRVLDGTYPCNKPEAALFAAIQLQVQTGNFSPGHHTAAWVKKQNVLPKQHQNKDLEPSILKEWGRLVNTNELNAKFKYVSTVCSLPTFGITLWTVREQVPKKRKLQEVLLGMTRDAIVRIDPQSRTILSSFPLKHVRRWAAGTNSFTLDYGQYKNEYYTVQVGGAEAEDISNTLAGYIDILLKRQREGRIQLEVDEGELAKVEELGPVCAVPNMSNIVMQGVGKYQPEDFRSIDLMPGMNMLNKGKAQALPGQLVISDWGDAARRINQLTNDTPQEYDEDDNDPSPVELKWNLLGQAANIGGAVSDVLHHSPTTNAQKITDQLADLLKAAHKAANASSDISLLEAAKKVSTAVADVLRTAHDLENDPESVPLKHRLQKAADALKGSSALMARAAQAEMVDAPSTQLILESAEQAAQALSAFCDVAGQTSTLRQAMPDIDALLLASRAAAAAGNDADNINLLEAARRVAGEVEKVLSTTRKDGDPVTECAPDLQALLAAAKAYANAPGKDENINLLEAVDNVSRNVKDLLSTTRKVDQAVAMADTLVEKAKLLAPQLMDPAALDQFRLEVDSVKRAAQAAFLDAKKMITDPTEMQLLMEKAKATNSALVQTLNAAEVAVARRAKDQEEVQAAASRVIAPLETIKFSGGDSRKVAAAAEETKKSVPSLLQAVKHQALAEPQRAEELLENARVVTTAVADLGKRVRTMQKREEEDRTRDEPRIVPQEAKVMIPDLENLLAQAKSLAKAAAEDENMSLLDAVRTVNSKVKNLLATTHKDHVDEKDDVAARDRNIMIGRLERLDEELEEMATFETIEEQHEAAPQLVQASLAVLESLEDPWQGVLRAARDVAEATKGLLTEQGEKFALFNVVRAKAKQAVASTLALANVATSIESEVTVPEMREHLLAETKGVHDVARRLVKELATASQQPDNWEAQANLVSTARELSKPFANNCNAARECIPVVESVATKQTLRFATQEASNAIVELVNACRAAGTVTGSEEVDAANQALAAAQQELDNAMSGAVSKTMSASDAQAAVERELQNVMAATGALSHAGAKDVGPATRNATDAVAGLVDACKALDAANGGQTSAMEGARELLPDLAALISASKENATHTSKDAEVGLLEAVQRVNVDVKALLLSTQGTDLSSAVDSQAKQQAVQTVQEALKDLDAARKRNVEGGDLVQLSADLEKRTAVLAQATGRVCQLAGDSKTRPEELDAAVSSAAAAFPALVTSVNKVVAASKSSSARQAMVSSTQLLGSQVAKVLDNAAASRVDPQAREAVQDGMNGGMSAGRDLLAACRNAMPGLQDLEKALRLLDDCLAVDFVPSAEASNDLRQLPSATDSLGDAAVAVIRAARVEPEDIGAQSVVLARCLSNILDVARSFCPAASGLGAALPVKQALAGLATSNDGKEVETYTKQVMAGVAAVMEAAKQASLQNPDEASDIKACAKAVKPALTTLVAAAKPAAKGGKLDGVREAAEEFGQTLDVLMSSIPEGGAQTSRLMSGAAGLIVPVQGMIAVSRAIVETPGDKAELDALTAQGKLLGAAVRRFREICKGMSPGTIECEAAVKAIAQSIEKLDEASMDAAVGILDVVAKVSNQVAQEKMVTVAKTLATRIQAIVEALKASDFELVARSAETVSKSVEEIKDAALQLASTTSNQDIQSYNLGMAKHVADASLLFMKSLSELTVDRTNMSLKRDLAGSATSIRDAISTLMKALRDGVSGLRACDEALQEVTECKAQLDSKAAAGKLAKGSNYGEAQQQLVEQARSLVQEGTSLFHIAKTEPQAVGDPSKSVAAALSLLTESSLACANAADDQEVRKMLLLSTQTVCGAVENLIAAAKRVAVDPENTINVQSLSASFEDLSDRIMSLIRSLKEGARGERDCRDAAGQMRKVVVDLDSHAVSAASGTFKLSSKAPLCDALDEAVSTAKAVQQNSAALISAAGEGQSALGMAARTLAQSFSAFANSAKLVAGITADITVQADCLMGAKAIGSSGAGLVMALSATKVQKSVVGERATALKEHVKEFLTLMKEHVSGPAAGVRAAMDAKHAVAECSGQLVASTSGSVSKVLPPLRAVLALINEYFVACRSTSGDEFQDKVSSLASETRTWVEELGLGKIKDASLRKDVQSTAQSVLQDTVALLELLMRQRKDTDKYQDSLVALAESYPKKVDRMLASARRIPGAGELSLAESVDEDAASQEMEMAASQIQAAADMLNSFQQMDDVELDESDLAASVLERARAITNATMELMKASVQAQQKLKASGRGDDTNVISAARLVSNSVQDLVFAANAVARGELQEDAIIAISRTVGGAVARLQASVKAKLPAGDAVQRLLSDATNKINAETKELLKEATDSMQEQLLQEETAKSSTSRGNAFGARQAKFAAEGEIAGLQRKLDDAYRALKLARNKEYQQEVQRRATNAPKVATNPAALARASMAPGASAKQRRASVRK